MAYLRNAVRINGAEKGDRDALNQLKNKLPHKRIIKKRFWLASSVQELFDKGKLTVNEREGERRDEHNRLLALRRPDAT